jgi:hypothetical protein
MEEDGGGCQFSGETWSGNYLTLLVYCGAAIEAREGRGRAGVSVRGFGW